MKGPKWLAKWNQGELETIRENREDFDLIQPNENIHYYGGPGEGEMLQREEYGDSLIFSIHKSAPGIEGAKYYPKNDTPQPNPTSQ